MSVFKHTSEWGSGRSLECFHLPSLLLLRSMKKSCIQLSYLVVPLHIQYYHKSQLKKTLPVSSTFEVFQSSQVVRFMQHFLFQNSTDKNLKYILIMLTLQNVQWLKSNFVKLIQMEISEMHSSVIHMSVSFPHYLIQFFPFESQDASLILDMC